MGCGERKFLDSTGVDIEKFDGVDIVHNLNEYPYPFKSNSYDKIVSYEVIEHLENPRKFVKEIKRILKKNGIVLICTNNRMSMWNYLFKSYELEGHISLFDYYTLQSLIKQYFELVFVSMEPYDLQDRTDLKFKIGKPFRRIVNCMMKDEHRERICIIAKKVVR